MTKALITKGDYGELALLFAHTKIEKQIQEELLSAIRGLGDGELGNLVSVLKENPQLIYGFAVNLVKKRISFDAQNLNLWEGIIRDEEKLLRDLSNSATK